MRNTQFAVYSLFRLGSSLQFFIGILQLIIGRLYLFQVFLATIEIVNEKSCYNQADDGCRQHLQFLGVLLLLLCFEFRLVF